MGHVDLGNVDRGKLNRREWAETNIHMRYSAADGSSLMTAAHLATICAVENLVMGHAGGTTDRTRDVEAAGPSPSYASICRLDEPQCAAVSSQSTPTLHRNDP